VASFSSVVQCADHLVAVLRLLWFKQISIHKCNFEEKTCHSVCVPIRITGFNSEFTVPETKMTGSHIKEGKWSNVFDQESSRADRRHRVNQ